MAKKTIVQEISRGQEILGSLIAWELSEVRVSYADLLDAIREAGLDENIIRIKSPQSAFSEAARKLNDQRVIDRLHEDATDITFQFTRRSREDGEYEYTREAFLQLSKFSGSVYCGEDPDLASQAETLIREAMDTYTGPQISKYIKKLFEESADIFSFPRDGGVYLVPAAHDDFVNQVDQFIAAIGGRLNRLPIAKGTDYGDRSFRETIAASIEKTLRAHTDAVEALTPENTDRSFENRAKEINESRFKVEVYAAYLGSEAERLLKAVSDAKARLRTKILEASASVVVDD